MSTVVLWLGLVATLVGSVWLGRSILAALDRADGTDWGNRWLNRIDRLNRLYCRRYHRLPEATIPLPKRGPALLVSNHVSGLDPLLLIAASARPVRFIIAKEEYHRFGLNWLFRAAGCIPVDRNGRTERAFREAKRALDAGEVIALFPHGKIHLDHEPRRPLKRGVVRLAQLAEAPVFPVRIDGIAAEGHVLLAVALPSRARIQFFPPVSCHQLESDDCLRQLASRLEPVPADSVPAT